MSMLVSQGLHADRELDLDGQEREVAAGPGALAEEHRALLRRFGELTSANVRLTSFAETLSHDLMQPIAALAGFLSMLEESADELTEEHLDWLRGAVKGKDRILNAIHALYRGVADEDLPLEAVDLTKVVGDVIERGVAELGGGDVVVGYLPNVMGDAAIVTQVLANLVQNACKYRSDERPLIITVKARSDRAKVVVEVVDTGKGIADDELEAVFEAGSRGGSAEGLPGHGTGLATVRMLMRRMGGDAWAAPYPAGGARICLQFQPSWGA